MFTVEMTDFSANCCSAEKINSLMTAIVQKTGGLDARPV